MNNFRAYMLTAAAVLLSATPAAAGTSTANLAVSATVSANCTIATSPLAFGAYDPIVGGAVDGTGSVTVSCTLGSPVSIQLGQGSNPASGSSDEAPMRRMSNGSDYLSYALYSDSGHQAVWENVEGVSQVGTGTEVSTTVYGTIPAGQNVPAGSYEDVVVATVTF